MEHSACMTAMTKRNDKSEGDHKHVLASPRSFFNPFQLPTPVKRIFDKFPLKKYPPNDLPCRSPRRQDANILHVFNTPERASRNEASFNPACLQWQVRNRSLCQGYRADSPRHISSSAESSSRPSHRTIMPLLLACCPFLLQRMKYHLPRHFNQLRQARS